MTMSPRASIRPVRPIGYKRIAAAPNWLTVKAPHVADVYALGDCISSDFADYINS
jgi:hypothetical protein